MWFEIRDLLQRRRKPRVGGAEAVDLISGLGRQAFWIIVGVANAIPTVSGPFISSHSQTNVSGDWQKTQMGIIARSLARSFY